MNAEAQIRDWQEQLRAAAAARTPLWIRGGDSKTFLVPRPAAGHELDARSLCGIVDYEPTELVVTVRAGTPLAELRRELAGAGQMLGFEPPAYGDGATVGGTVACGLSGPRRPYAGALRDFVLGVRCLNGRAEDLRFGGRVMKNVAGYDVSRLMAGARGTLGILLEISFKVLPLPERERTYCRQQSVAGAIRTMNELAARPLPLSASAWTDGMLYVRFSGAAAAVEAAARDTGMDEYPDGEGFWEGLREQRLDFFTGAAPIWRLSLPSMAAMPDVPGDWVVDWGGAQRWLRSTSPAADIHAAAGRAGGYAALYRGRADGPALPELPPPLLRLQRRLKQAFDPAGILNPGLLYTETSC